MSLKVYIGLPANGGTEVTEIDTFVTDGGDTYPVVNKPITSVASTLEYSSTFKNQYNGGFTKSGSDIVLDTTPVPGLQGVIPGTGHISLAAYDQNNVPGNSNPRVNEVDIYIGDVSTINQYQYFAPSGENGIGIIFVDNITGIGAALSMVSLACTDGAGTALTYQATGTALRIPAFSAFGLVAASADQGTNSITCGSASDFIPGRWVEFNIGQPTSEIIQVSSITDWTLTFSSSFNYPHYIDETIYDCLQQLKARFVVPENATGGVAANLLNISLNPSYDKTVRF